MKKNKTPEPIFSQHVGAGSRLYYLDVFIDKKQDKFLTISEISTDKAPKKMKRQRIFIHSQNLVKFAKVFNEILTQFEVESIQTKNQNGKDIGS